MEKYFHIVKTSPYYLDVDDSILYDYSFLPLEKNESLLTVLSSEFNYNTISNFEDLIGEKIEVIEIDNKTLEDLFDIYFSNNKEITNIFALDNGDNSNHEIIDYLNNLIEVSIKNRYTDIHVEPFKDFLRIRCRNDGRLFEYDKLSKKNQSIVTTRLKILGGLEISEKRLPQDGRITFTYRDRDVDLRIASVPVLYGEKISIRILDSKFYFDELDKLGLKSNQIRSIRDVIHKNEGLILVCGPTNSGKSTTVAAMINEVNREDINIITIEDPVENKINGVNQIEVNYKTGLHFENALNAILRHDPEIISIGELRSKETISTGLRASMTGHMVFSTIHTTDSISTIFRMKDMGAENYLISNALKLVISQRLIRLLCPSCKEKYIDDSNYFSGPTELFRPIGCNHCQDGFKGRIGVFEILEITEEIRDLINKGAEYKDILKAAKKNNFKSLNFEFNQLLLAGYTSIGEYVYI